MKKKQFKFIEVLVKHRKKCVSCTIVSLSSLALFAYLYKAGFTASQSRNSAGEILSDIGISQDAEMDFARILPPVGGGNVTIPKTTDTVTCMGGGTCTGQSSRGKFTITGSDGVVNVGYTDGILSDGSNTMPLDVSSSTIGNDTTVTISSGTATLNVGGILAVGVSQAAGIYNTSNANGLTYIINIDY